MNHVISIGINNVGGLTPLKAAASGAEEFANWAKSQGYSTTLFTDVENKSVSPNDVFNKISQIVESKNCEKLIIFFSGHGILRSPGQEVWLLPNAKVNPNESINLTGSIDNARTTGIPYIVFISDACRILTSELQFTGNGSVIFPICDDNNEDTAIDILYATRPGNPANEYSGESNSKKFGLFTQALIEVLTGEYPEVIWSDKASGNYLPSYYDIKALSKNSEYKSLAAGKWEISTVHFEKPIKSIVNDKASTINITLTQFPEIRIQYQSPKPFLSQFEDSNAKRLYLSASSKLKSEKLPQSIIVEWVRGITTSKLKEFIPVNEVFDTVKEHHASQKETEIIDVDADLINNSIKIFDATGRESFETETGFTIVGDRIAEVFVNGTKEIFAENDRDQVRIHYNSKVSSALIVLKNGQSIPLAVLNGFIGTLVFDQGRLLTVNYTPSRNNYRYHDFKRNENDIRIVRAFVASAANEGFDYQETFRNEFTKDGYLRHDDAGSYLRREKSLDPSLGLYAVYAYRQAGLLKDIRSVYKYMRQEENKMIFDVAMLAEKLNEEKGRLAPFCPMLALGWAYRQRFEKFLHPQIKEASNSLIPNLWTTFSKKGTELIISLYNQNLLQ